MNRDIKKEFRVDDPVVVIGQNYSLKGYQGYVEGVGEDSCEVRVDEGDFYSRRLFPKGALRNNADRFFDIEKAVSETDFSLSGLFGPEF